MTLNRRRHILAFIFPLLFAFNCKPRSSSSNELSSSTTGVSYPIKVQGGDEKSFVPNLNSEPLQDSNSYDAIVIGAGLGGLSSAIYLSDQGMKVLVLEKEAQFGGLASGSSAADGVRYDRGAAYWTDAYKEEAQILQRIGLGDFNKRFPIPEPIDSYYWNGKLYDGIWEEKTVAALPPSFALFKQELQFADKNGQIPNQPFEEFAAKIKGNLNLDTMTASEWIQSMPSTAKARTGEKEKAIYARFTSYTQKLGDRKGMGDVLDLLDLYSRSALGSPTDKVSAMAFANFYISEVDTRYTSIIGTGIAAEKMVEILKDASHKDLVTMKAKSPVGKVTTSQSGVTVTYLDNGKVKVSNAKYAVFAAQVKIAPKLIEGFAQQDPERTNLIQNMKYAHYSVHAAVIEGHPYRAAYDTWTKAQDATKDDFTDVILGRWVDLKGYADYRDFRRDPPGDSILTIYHPLNSEQTASGYDDKTAIDIAKKAVTRMQSMYKKISERPIVVKSVETNRWPYSVHVAEPGHFISKAKILRRPFGRIYFANSNLGTPAFEEALFRGHCAAVNILLKSKPGFSKESWSECPIEQ